MKNKSIALFGLLLTLFTFIAPAMARAVDIPLLTWERGRVQQVVLGGGAVENHWTVSLMRVGAAPRNFTPSNPNTAGYVVYTLDLPADLPLGAYTIQTTGNGSPQTNVAAVDVIALTAASVPYLPKDLTFMIAMIVLLTATISTMRARKYSPLAFINTQNLLPELETVEGLAKASHKLSFATTPYRLRVRAITALPQSLMRYLLLRNGEALHRISPIAYAFAPVAGIVGAFIASVESHKAGGIAKTSLAVFIAVAIVGIADSFSGIIATATFWAIELATGNVSSFRDFLVMLSLGLAWVGPGLFASIYRDAASRDFATKKSAEDQAGSPAARIAGIVEAAIVGGLIFALGQKLVNSVLINISAARSVTIGSGVIIVLALALRAVGEDALFGRPVSGELATASHSEYINIARVSSPLTAFALFATYFAFSYIWTQSALRSLIFSVLFAFPHFLLLVRFDSLAVSGFGKISRQIFLESVVAAGATLLIFRQINTQPLLANDRAKVFLLLAAIPLIAHALYSAVCDSAERKGIIEP
jgi:hypothetical protein